MPREKEKKKKIPSRSIDLQASLGQASGDTSQPASPRPLQSPRRLSRASSLSKETLDKASEEYAERRSPYKSSISSPPPAPPPAPPPFLVHGYNPAAERRTAAKSFKEELQDHSMRRRGDHFLQSSPSLNNSAHSSINSSLAKPRTSFDGSSSSSSSSSVARSVRTIRPREPVQIQSQELPDDAGDALGYDDDDVGGYSTRTNSPRESTPEVDENEVDKKADEFIARFREQMRLERIGSIKISAGSRGVKHGK